MNSTGYFNSQNGTNVNDAASSSNTLYNYQYKNYTSQDSYYNTSSFSQNTRSYEPKDSYTARSITPKDSYNTHTITPKESYNTRTIKPKEYSPALPSQNNSSADYTSYNTSDYTWSNYPSISNNNNYSSISNNDNGVGYSSNSYFRDSSASSNGIQSTSTQYSSYYG